MLRVATQGQISKKEDKQLLSGPYVHFDSLMSASYLTSFCDWANAQKEQVVSQDTIELEHQGKKVATTTLFA